MISKLMASTPMDSFVYKDMFSTENMREVFSDRNYLQKWLDVEAALARAQASLDIIPKESADEISTKANISLFDLDSVRHEMDVTAHPLLSMVRCLARLCDSNHGEYVHWGATTQDIMDTGVVLQLKEAHSILLGDLNSLKEAMVELAKRHKATVMTGRTHTQHALPTTFGLKVIVWAAEIARHMDRMKQIASRLFVVQFAGAVGTLASLGKDGLQVQKHLAEELDLAVPEVVWHTARDRFVEYVMLLCMIGNSLAKVANEIKKLQGTEFDELFEPYAEGRVSSSTMPQKRNPEICESIVALSRILNGLTVTASESLIHEHERDGIPWQTEWYFIPVACCLSSGILAQSYAVIKGLTVKEANMRRNLDLTGGLIMSEAVMMGLASKIGRQTAHDIVSEAAMKCYHTGIEFIDCLSQDSRISEMFNRDEIMDFLRPENYVGLAEQMVEETAAYLESLH